MKVVIALGGNAILKQGEKGTSEEQFRNIQESCKHIAGAIKNGTQILITHGNGPQVGNILIQNQLASTITPSMPLSICGAQTQGMIGYMIQQTLLNTFRQEAMKKQVVSLVTQVLVDEYDAAFSFPTKPIGPFYSEEQARELISQGVVMKEDSGRGWRMVVPSPEPLEIVEKEQIRELMDNGFTVIAAGGGGIPVVEDEAGYLKGVTAVIDKDLASQRVANDVGADVLIILTVVDRVAINFNKPNQEDLDSISLKEARLYSEQGHFGEGSMQPKISAAIKFIEGGGKKVLITSLEKLSLALAGEAGTVIE